MKKTTLSLIALFAAMQFSYAQTNTFPSSGDVGIGTTSPTNSLTFGSGSSGFAAYKSADQTTNYERFAAQWQGNNYVLGNYYAGTGTARSVQIGINSITGATSGVNRLFAINLNTSTTTGIFDFNVSTQGIGSITTFNFNHQASSGIQNSVSLQPTISQTGTAGYRGLFISPFESTIGSGIKYLIDAGTNSAASGGGTHSPKFSITNTGSGYIAGDLAIGTATLPSGYKLPSTALPSQHQ